MIIEAVSRLLNGLVGGSIDESLSARSYRLREGSRGWYVSYRTINSIFFWQNNHCRGAFRNSNIRMQKWLDEVGFD